MKVPDADGGFRRHTQTRRMTNVLGELVELHSWAVSSTLDKALFLDVVDIENCARTSRRQMMCIVDLLVQLHQDDEEDRTGQRP